MQGAESKRSKSKGKEKKLGMPTSIFGLGSDQLGESLYCARTLCALRTTFRLDSPAKNPFQTPSKSGHPNYPSSRQLCTTFPSHHML